MGLQAAFSKWAIASLDEVRSGDLGAAAGADRLNEVEAAYRVLFDAGVLGDSQFIENAVDPLRTGADPRPRRRGTAAAVDARRAAWCRRLRTTGLSRARGRPPR